MNVVTFLSDFGLKNGYVSQMKGVILQSFPRAHCIDITHMIPPQKIHVGAFILRSSASYFPKGTIHLSVVDPGVGTQRRGIVVVTKNQIFVGPDNGLLIPAAKSQGEFLVYDISNNHLFRNKVSQTFHGRDIFSPVVGHILNGTSFEAIGNKITDYIELDMPQPISDDTTITSEVIFIDDFGNIITNISDVLFHSKRESLDECTIKIKNKKTQVPYRMSYGFVKEKQLLVTIGSTGLVEIALNQGNAADALQVTEGDKITFSFS